MITGLWYHKSRGFQSLGLLYEHPVLLLNQKQYIFLLQHKGELYMFPTVEDNVDNGSVFTIEFLTVIAIVY